MSHRFVWTGSILTALIALAATGGEHDRTDEGRPRLTLPFVSGSAEPKVPAVGPKGRTAASIGHIETADKYLGDARRSWMGALAFCATQGQRLATLEEAELIFAKHRAELEEPERAEVWTAKRTELDGRVAFRLLSTDGKGAVVRRFDARPDRAAKPLCVKPRDPVKEMIDVCPVGEMDYCDGVKCHTDCDGVKSTIGGRRSFMCGNYALALSRCLQSRMGRKSWQIFLACPLRNGVTWAFGGYPAHAMNLITLPSPKSGPRRSDVRYCVVEPQQLYAKSKESPLKACWEGTYATSPTVPESVGKRLCDEWVAKEGWTGSRFVDLRVYPAGTVHTGNADYAFNEKAFRHLVYTTGIPGKDLLPIPEVKP